MVHAVERLESVVTALMSAVLEIAFQIAMPKFVLFPLVAVDVPFCLLTYLLL